MYILGIKLKLPTATALIYSLIVTLIAYLCALGFLTLNLIKEVTVYEMTVITFISMSAESMGLDTNVHSTKAFMATILLCLIGLLSVDIMYLRAHPKTIPAPTQTYTSPTPPVDLAVKPKTELAIKTGDSSLNLKLSNNLVLPTEETKTMNEQFISHMNPANNGVDRTLNRYRD